MEVTQNMNKQSMLWTLWMKQPWLLIQSSRFWRKRMFGGQSCSKRWRELTFEPHAKLSFCLRAEWKWQDGVCFPNYAITKKRNAACGARVLSEASLQHRPLWYFELSPWDVFWVLMLIERGSSLSAAAHRSPPPVSSRIPPRAGQSDDHTQM